MFDASTIWLKTSYFFLSHRSDLRKWWVIILIAAMVFLLVFAFTNAIMYLFNTSQYGKLIASIAISPLDYEAIRQNSAPQPVEFGAISVVSVGQGRYDLIVPVRNPNVQWVASSVEYQFSIQGNALESDTDFVLPQGEKFFTASNVEFGQTPSAQDVRISVVDTAWQHLDSTDALARETFIISEVSFSLSTAGGYEVYRVTADVANDSFHNFWEAQFAVVFFNGEQVVGIEYATVKPMEAGAQETVMVQHAMDAGAVTSVAVIPDTNIFDSANIFGS